MLVDEVFGDSLLVIVWGY